MLFRELKTDGTLKRLENYVFSRDDIAILSQKDRLKVRSSRANTTDVVVDADVNNDGYVDLSDVRIVRSAIQNRTSYDTDVNDDGKTDEADVLIVKAKAHEAIVAAAPSQRRKRFLTGTWAELKR